MKRLIVLLFFVCFSSASISAQIKWLSEYSTSPIIEYTTPDLPEVDLRNPTSLFDALDQAFDLISFSSTLEGGFNAAMLVPDSAVWKRASGLAQELPYPVDLTTEHMMGMASITKSFVAATLLLMYEEDSLSLDDPIGMYLDPSYPNIPFNATIRNLLSHRTGIHDYFNDVPNMISQIWLYPDSIWDADTILFNYVFEPNFPVDEDWKYSNTNYLLAGKIIEYFTGEPWYKEVRKRIIDPLGLDHTFAYPFEEVPDSLPFSHVWADAYGTVPFQELQGNGISMDAFFSAGSSAGCLITTPEDLVLFTNALYSGELLQPATLDEMQVDYTDGQGSFFYLGPITYGLGTHSLNALPYDNWGHTGNIFYKSMAVFFPDYDITIAVQQNDARAWYNLIDLFDLLKTLLNTYVDYSPVAVHSIEAPRSVQIFPNPSMGIFHIDVPTNDPLEITVYDAMGQIILPAHQLVSGQIDLSAQPPGLYFLELNNGLHSITKRIVKQ